MLNLLIAYPYLDRETQRLVAEGVEAGKVRFLLDSGAFTAWKSGKAIALDDYCRFIESLPFKPWRYFMLDVIGDPEGTLKNYELMLKRGFNPIPIFTRGDDPKMIEEFYKTSDLVAVGGLVGTPGNRGFVKGIMETIGDRKVHWLGFGGAAFIKNYRPYSCDSSSGSGGVRFGRLFVYDFRGGFVDLTKTDAISRPPRDVCKLIERHGEDPSALRHAGEWTNKGAGRTILQRLSLKAFVKYSMDLEARLGVLYFNALNAKDQLQISLAALAFWESKR